MDSILLTIKNMLGIEADFDGFDVDVIVAINTAFTSLNQLGIGPTTGFVIAGVGAVWSDFLGTELRLEAVKTYIFLKTRLSFDPPASGFLVESMSNQLSELEWRLTVLYETTV